MSQVRSLTVVDADDDAEDGEVAPEARMFCGIARQLLKIVRHLDPVVLQRIHGRAGVANAIGIMGAVLIKAAAEDPAWAKGLVAKFDTPEFTGLPKMVEDIKRELGEVDCKEWTA